MRFRVLPPPHVGPPALTPEQDAAAAPFRGVSVVVGAPGTGKTTLVAAAAARRVRAGGSLDRLIVLAHSRSAAQQLRRQIARQVDRAQTSPQVTTIHGLALGLLRRYWPHEDSPWRLLRAPEQEQRIRELLAGMPPRAWPEDVTAAVGTRAFARQLREVLARARQLSLDPETIARYAAQAEDELFASAARFVEEYLTVGDFSGTLDYAELVYRTRLLLREPSVAAGVAAAFDEVLVDDAQEADPAQVGLLADLSRIGLPLMAVGDPHQRIGGYRGASPTAVADLAALPGATLHTLGTGHRASQRVAEALRTLSSRMDARYAPPSPLASLLAGEVRARVFDDTSAELASVAAELRHSVAVEGLAWADLAVITRAGRAQLSAVAAELMRLGVPVDVSGDEIALAEQPAVATLLSAVSVAARGDGPEADEARLLLSSPLCGLDGVSQRRLGRELLERHRSLGSSSVLLGRCLTEPSLLEGVDTEEASSARALAALLAEARRALAEEAEVQQVLWGLWDATPWPSTLRDRALRGSRRANADLDAIVELFDQASRQPELRGAPGARTFLNEISGQEIPADTGRELAVSRRGVRVVTAHRTRGLEWERVWVIGVQEGLWPRMTRAGMLLDASRLGPERLEPRGPSSQLADERQLFYVACSRARTGLSISAVQGVDGEGGHPSRFLAEIGVPVERIHGRPGMLLSTAALVGDLRRAVVDEAASPGLRRAAALRLADLASVDAADGTSAFPGAHPGTWWGIAEPTSAPAVPGGPVVITGSSLEVLLECPRRWFLGRRARADTGRVSKASVGDVVHLLAKHAATDHLTADELHAKLDEVWERIPFETEWLSATERSEIDEALDRFARYHDHTPNELLAVERRFRVPLTVAGREVLLDGTVDRLERQPDGRLRIVDMKTGRRVLREADVVDHAQLGIYQLAATLGAFDDIAAGERAVAAPALLFLRDGDALPTLVAQPSIDESPALPKAELIVGPTWVHDKIAEGVAIIDGGRFDAVECGACRYCAFTASCPARGPRTGAQR
ncbi:ATP-dependent helicase [Tessaracoccus sp. Z1128]